MLADDAFHLLADLALGDLVARTGGVGRVRQERQRAAQSERGDVGQVDRIVVYRRVVELEVAGAEDGSVGRVQRRAEGIGDVVVDVERLEDEVPTELDLLL